MKISYESRSVKKLNHVKSQADNLVLTSNLLKSL